MTAALVASSPARSGVYLEHEALMPNPAEPTKLIKETVRTWYEGRRMKRESPLRGETVVVDLEKGEVFGFHDRRKTWWRMPAQRYQSLALGALEVMGIQIGPDGQPRTPEPLFVETRQESTIEGRKAREVKVASPAVPGVTMTLWISKDRGLPADALEQQMRLSMADPQGPAFDALFRHWARLDGFPVQNVTTVRTPSGTLMSSETLLRVRAEKIPASAFGVPQGFALVDDPLTERERSQGPQAPFGIAAPLGSAPSTPAPATAPH